MEKEIMDNLPILIPLIVLQLILAITALIHILKHDNFKIMKKQAWIPIVIFIGFIGPISYFLFGRGED